MDKPCVMLVDDEPHVLNAIRRLLHSENVETVIFTAPADALRELKCRDFAVIVSDYRMPEMDGVAFLEQAREQSPDTMRIMLTGYADLPAVIQTVNRCGVARFLTKPWNDEELCMAVRQAVMHYGLVRENQRLQSLTARQNMALKELNLSLERKVDERTAEVTRLNADLREGLAASVRLLGELGEMHSTVIGRHAKRVAQLARDVAGVLGWPDGEIALLEIAAVLHDTGKIGVPAAILEKPEKNMTDREYAAYKSHAIKGEFIAGLLPAAVWAAAVPPLSVGQKSNSACFTDRVPGNVPAMIRHHHERFDGSGYPDGIQGEGIPFGARVIAVADAYDRFLNNRENFTTTTPEDALRHLQAHVTAWYDPSVVDALTVVIKDATKPEVGATELEVRPGELREGMVLSRDLRTVSGTLLLAGNTRLAVSHIERLQKHFGGSSFGEWIYVYRR